MRSAVCISLLASLFAVGCHIDTDERIHGCIQNGVDLCGRGFSPVKIEFDSVSDVIVEPWLTPLSPIRETSVQVQGDGLVDGRHGNVLMNFSLGLDSLGCREQAEKAKSGGYALFVEAYGEVSEMIADMPCVSPPSIPGGPVPTIPGPVPPTPAPVPPAYGQIPAPCPLEANPAGGFIPGCNCPPPLPTILVRVEKFISCSLGTKSSDGSTP